MRASFLQACLLENTVQGARRHFDAWLAGNSNRARFGGMAELSVSTVSACRQARHEDGRHRTTRL